METSKQMKVLHQTQSSSSSSSSICSNNYNHSSAKISSLCETTDLNTELKLGLSISSSRQRSLFVKVYMEGIPIGRKLNLLEHHSYDQLVIALCHMFKTIILCPNLQPLNSRNFHVLTYEDQEGDWMLVGDVPWEMFLSSVKRLKITRADSC